jgi:hypothetical protein
MDRINIVVPQFTGVTTAIVAFCFVCVIFPHLVKNKTQFYAGFTAVLLVILIHGLALMLYNAPGFQVFAGVATCVLQLGAIVTLFLSAGGITLRELGGDMARAYEVIRRGEEGKTIIVPLSGEMANRPPSAAVSVRDDDDEPTEHRIDLPDSAGWQRRPVGSPSPTPPSPPPSPPPPDDAKIPLE